MVCLLLTCIEEFLGGNRHSIDHRRQRQYTSRANKVEPEADLQLCPSRHSQFPLSKPRRYWNCERSVEQPYADGVSISGDVSDRHPECLEESAQVQECTSARCALTSRFRIIDVFPFNVIMKLLNGQQQPLALSHIPEYASASNAPGSMCS